MLGSFIAWPKAQKNRTVYLSCLNSFLLLFFASFKGQFFFRHYFASLYPFYILSIIFIIAFITRFLPLRRRLQQHAQSISVLIIGGLSLSLIGWSYFISAKHHPRATAKADAYATSLKEMIGEDKDILFVRILPQPSNAYNATGTMPPIPHYFIPATSHDKFPFFLQEAILCVQEKRVSQVIIFNKECDERLTAELKKQGYSRIENESENITQYKLQGELNTSPRPMGIYHPVCQ